MNKTIDTQILEEIRGQLERLEATRNIKILLAVESGSRAWGFPSPDSDYDIRIIYAHKEDWYLTVNNKKDTIDYFHGELIDVSGWDIRKTLSLLSKSNSTPAEWSQSPIVYQEATGFRDTLLTHVKAYFNPIHSLNHYRGIALNSYKSLSLDDSIKFKKLFYVIRPILAAKWIIKYQTVPPMDIQGLLEVEDDQAVVTMIHDLIALKSTADEDYIHQVGQPMQQYVAEQFAFIKDVTLEYSATHDLEPLNQFFRKIIRAVK